MTEIYKTLTFDAAHRLLDHDGRCAFLHGHTFEVEVWITGVSDEQGMVVDFGHVKDAILTLYDHKTILNPRDSLVGSIRDVQGVVGVHSMDEGGNPTSENIAAEISVLLLVRKNITQVRVRVWETPTSYAEVVSRRDKI